MGCARAKQAPCVPLSGQTSHAQQQLEVLGENSQTRPIATVNETMKLYFEDFKPGPLGTFGPHHVSREDIVAFAAQFDPQPMHLDEEAAKRSMLKGLSGSGWHMCSLLMRICWDGFIHNIASAGSPGVDEVKWVSPLRPGDDLTVEVAVLGTRESKSRPDVGFVQISNDLRNASRVTLMTATLPLMIQRRAAKIAS
jgi:acyl dehydratase